MQLLVSEGARQDGATFLRSVRAKKEWDFIAVISPASKSPGMNAVRDFHAVHDAWFRGWSTDKTCTVGFFTRHQGWRFQQVQLDHGLDVEFRQSGALQAIQTPEHADFVRARHTLRKKK